MWKKQKKKLKRGDSQTSIRYDVYFETTSSVLSIPIKITLLRYSISVLLPCFFHNPIGPKVMTNKSPEEKKNVLLVSSLSHLCIFKIHLTVLKQWKRNIFKKNNSIIIINDDSNIVKVFLKSMTIHHLPIIPQIPFPPSPYYIYKKTLK